MRSKRHLVAAAALVAVVASVVAVSFVIRLRSPGPVEALERWAAATRHGDCEASYAGLASSVKDVSVVGEKENWCAIIGSPTFIGELKARRAVVSGDRACVEADVSDPATGAWTSKTFVLTREGGSWKVDLGSDPASSGVAGCATR